jgi:hypothetical protein
MVDLLGCQFERHYINCNDGTARRVSTYKAWLQRKVTEQWDNGQPESWSTPYNLARYFPHEPATERFNFGQVSPTDLFAAALGQIVAEEEHQRSKASPIKDKTRSIPQAARLKDLFAVRRGETLRLEAYLTFLNAHNFNIIMFPFTHCYHSYYILYVIIPAGPALQVEFIAYACCKNLMCKGGRLAARSTNAVCETLSFSFAESLYHHFTKAHDSGVAREDEGHFREVLPPVLPVGDIVITVPPKVNP